MSDKINFAILGAGGIAEHMAKTVLEMDNVRPYAVAARDGARAAAFAKRFHFEKSYGSYREMVEDPKVQLVYVATPHSHHYVHAKLCLEHGKNVLCEKAFTSHADQAEKLVALAREKKLLLTEAIWTRYMPFSRTIRELVDGGAVGEPVSILANLGYNVRMNERITDPALAGGALLDLSVYTLNFAYMTFGTEVKRMRAECVKHPTGVDAQDNIFLEYKSGRAASLYATFMANVSREGLVFGDRGYLVVNNINNPDWAAVHDNERRVKEVHYCPPKISGYEYEVEASIRAIREGAVECPEMPHAETLRIMRIFDDIRAVWGIEYPRVMEE